MLDVEVQHALDRHDLLAVVLGPLPAAGDRAAGRGQPDLRVRGVGDADEQHLQEQVRAGQDPAQERQQRDAPEAGRDRGGVLRRRGTAEDGRLISLEYSPKHAEIATRNVARAGLEKIVEVRVGAALESLPQLADENPPPFDLVFIDADKANNAHYVEWALRLTRAGSLIIVDNVVRGGRIADAGSDAPDVQGTRAAVELIAAHPRLSGTAIQTVGPKGYDGFALARVLG
ncbi:tRNA 5-hydroxyuridine methyltransferase [Streptomyces glaucescens]